MDDIERWLISEDTLKLHGRNRLRQPYFPTTPIIHTTLLIAFGGVLLLQHYTVLNSLRECKRLRQPKVQTSQLFYMVSKVHQPIIQTARFHRYQNCLLKSKVADDLLLLQLGPYHAPSHSKERHLLVQLTHLLRCLERSGYNLC